MNSGRVAGKTAFITGAARGQGRSHALRLAEEGANIIAIDICDQIEGVAYEMATPEDLKETVRIVEAAGGQIEAFEADVRDLVVLGAAAEAGLRRFGAIDIVCANAGISSYGRTWELSPQLWQDTIDVDLTGVWHTVKATVPAMVERNQGGSIIFTSSSAALVGIPTLSHYTAAKTGLLGLARSLAQELGEYFIRVNTIHPTGVDTAMALNPSTYALFMPDKANPTREDAAEMFRSMNILPIPWVDPVDISNAVLWLASDEARYVTGAAIPVDAGVSQKYPG
jgi:SDR family mycofactocin-dependent oxidoreductase